MTRKLTVTSLLAGLTLALALVFTPARPASAQQGVTWSTGFQVQNLGSTSATVTIQMINQDGTTAATISNETIAMGASKTYYPLNQVNSGFNGSAIVSSTQPVAAILNILGNFGVSGQPYYSEAANGITSINTANAVSLPLIMRNNGGYSTWFSVQNAGTAAADVTVTFRAGTAGNNLTPTAVNIKPGASYTFDQAVETRLGDKFVGSASVTSAQPLAVVVNQVGTGASKTLLTYSGFPEGATSVVLPLVMQANANFFTGISIQNVSASSVSLTVAYSGSTLTNDTATVPAGGSVVFIKNGTTKYVGSATVTSTGNIVAVVNQLSTVAGKGTAYEGINRAKATDKVSLPLLMNANAGFFTGVQCANVGSSSTTVTIAFSKDDKTAFTPTAVSQTIAAGGSYTWLQNTFGQKYVGSGTVTTNPTTNIVCIVNQINDGSTGITGDAFLTYNGINY